jgi:hypothetical protein
VILSTGYVKLFITCEPRNDGRPADCDVPPRGVGGAR